MTKRLMAWILIALMSTGAVSADEPNDLKEFAHRLDLALGDMSWYGLDITERKARSVESNQAWFAEGMPVVGEPAPLLVRNKKFWVICDKTSTRSNLDSTLGMFLRLGAKYFAEEGTISLWLVRISDLDFERFKNDTDAKWSWVPAEIAKTKAELATVRPIAKFGEFGLFAGPQVSPEQARDLEALVLKVTHPVLYSGINLIGMKVFEPLRIEGFGYPATGAADLVAAMPKGGDARPAAAAAGGQAQPNGQRIIGKRVGKDQTTVVYADGTSATEATATAGLVGPPIQGINSKEAERPPPSREPPPPKIGQFWRPPLSGITGFYPVEPPVSKPAAKPGPSMVARAKQAEEERAALKARREKAATESNNAQIRLINARRAKEQQTSELFAKRRAYVNAQVNRPDALTVDSPVEEPANADGSEVWYVVYLHNNTDVTLDVEYRFWGGPAGHEREQVIRLPLIPTGVPYRLPLFADKRRPGAVRNPSWKKSPVPTDYLYNLHVH